VAFGGLSQVSAEQFIPDRQVETIVAVGAIISDIPCVDKIKINKIKTGDKIIIEGDEVKVI